MICLVLVPHYELRREAIHPYVQASRFCKQPRSQSGGSGLSMDDPEGPYRLGLPRAFMCSSNDCSSVSTMSWFLSLLIGNEPLSWARPRRRITRRLGEASTRRWRRNVELPQGHGLAGRPQSLIGEHGIAYVLKQELER